VISDKDMSELFSKLGIDWKLLIAQAVNFLILLTVLKFTVYKPLLGLLKKRKIKIEKGLEDARLSGEKLEEAELIKKDKLAEADHMALTLIKKSEVRGKELEAELLDKARKKERDLLSTAKMEAERQTEAEKIRFFEEAAGLIKQAIVQVVKSSPEEIDEKLIHQAVAKLKT